MISVRSTEMCRNVLKRMIEQFRYHARDQQAVTATEYAILLSLLVIGSMGIIGSIGSKFFVLYTTIANAVGDTV